MRKRFDCHKNTLKTYKSVCDLRNELSLGCETCALHENSCCPKYGYLHPDKKVELGSKVHYYERDYSEYFSGYVLHLNPNK